MDADDFCEGNSQFDLLFRMRSFNPALRINLFTCPGLCSEEWLRCVREISWIEMYFHTWKHEVVVRMPEEQFVEELIRWEEMSIGPKGFKAPGWEMTPWAYETLKERGWWVFDNWPPYYKGNRERPSMKCLLPDCYSKYRLVHLHIHDVCDNGLKGLYFEEKNHPVFNTKFFSLKDHKDIDSGYNFWMAADEFVFINDVIEERASARDMLPEGWD